MQCSQCGRDVPPDAVFCPHCGERVPKPSVRTANIATEPATAANRLRQAAAPTLDDAAEEDLWSDGYSPKAMFGEFIAIDVLTLLGVIAVVFGWNTGAGWITLLIALVALWGGLALVYAYRRFSVRYRLTKSRFFHERGILSRVTDRIEAIDIDDVTVRQGLIERMLGVGTIGIASSDRTHPMLQLPGIDNVQQVANLIDATRRAERQRRGLHIEAI